MLFVISENTLQAGLLIANRPTVVRPVITPALSYHQRS
jgi:hypothetical protein